MEMFDEQIATLIKADGTVEQKRWVTEDILQSEAMDKRAGRSSPPSDGSGSSTRTPPA